MFFFDWINILTKDDISQVDHGYADDDDDNTDHLNPCDCFVIEKVSHERQEQR